MGELHSLGEPHPDLEAHHLKDLRSRDILAACNVSKDYEVLELRHLRLTNGKVADVIIVDCVNDQVPSRNSFGIKTREPLALCFEEKRIPEVRALRKNFPEVPHLNYVLQNQPASLCLYFEPWSALQHTWTPQKHLQRILWWLSETAKGTLHKDDQLVERLYFESPFEVIVPPDFDAKIQNELLSLTFSRLSKDSKVIHGFFLDRNQAKNNNIPSIEPVMLNLTPIIHGFIERYPKNLGDIQDQLSKKGISLINALITTIRQMASPNGLTSVPSDQCLLILAVPLKRTAQTEPETYDLRAFLLDINIAALGKSTGALTMGRGKDDGRFYALTIIGSTPETGAEEWRNIGLLPIEIKRDVTNDFARQASGIVKETADFNGVVAGVGALGSTLADLWSKEYWGNWTLIDADSLKPHNIVRHIARWADSGEPKVDVVKTIIEANYHPGYYSVAAIEDSATNWTNIKVKDAMLNADLVVDATTTLEVPREMSQREGMPRCVSVFLTPSGQNSALLFESSDCQVRLDSLEAQYYRAILNSDWGPGHLAGHSGNLWVGAGCRDFSTIISQETVTLHAAVLASQIRQLRDQQSPCIRVWSLSSDIGNILAWDVPIHFPIYCFHKGWKVLWDEGIVDKLRRIRNSGLPKETGGVIVGYIDHKIQSIIIVDVLKAPPDSEADQTGFTRGAEGLKETLDEIARRTANIVGYLGEWHSHPLFVSAYPSQMDRELIELLAETRALEGEPALMVIVGSAGELSITVGELIDR